MSYEVEPRKLWERNLQALMIGGGFWLGVGIAVNIFRTAPAWILVLVSFWLTGWAMIGVRRFWRWIRS
jgi:hypothetical protein